MISFDCSHFDVIICGTGLSNSIIASAAAKSGKSVLHIDHRDHYGSTQSTLRFGEISNFLSSHYSADETQNIDNTQEGKWTELIADEKIDCPQFLPVELSSPFSDFEIWQPLNTLPVTQTSQQITNDAQQINHTNTITDTTSDNLDQISSNATSSSLPPDASLSDLPSSDEAVQESSSVSSSFTVNTVSPMNILEQLQSCSRRFNLDVSPSLLFAQSPLVELLVSSGVANYVEFKSIDPVYLYNRTSNSLIHLPISRSEIFQSNVLSMIDKRNLMKFFNSILLNDEKQSKQQQEQFQNEIKQFTNRPFIEYLKFRQLSDYLIQIIFYAIGFFNNFTQIETSLGLNKLLQFLHSLGRYSPGVFLFPLYGNSEISQGFTRLAAIHGTIYVLRFQPKSIVINKSDNFVHGIITPDDQLLTCNYLITDQDYVPDKTQQDNQQFISRAICIINKPLKSSANKSTQQLHVSVFPPGSITSEQHNLIRVVQLNDTTGICPKDHYILYLSMISEKDTTSSFDLLKQLMQKLTVTEQSETTTNTNNPILLWSCFYQQKKRNIIKPALSAENWLITSDPSLDISDDEVFQDAKRVIDTLIPGLDLNKLLEHESRKKTIEQHELEQINNLNNVLQESEQFSTQLQGQTNSTNTSTSHQTTSTSSNSALLTTTTSTTFPSTVDETAAFIDDLKDMF